MWCKSDPKKNCFPTGLATSTAVFILEKSPTMRGTWVKKSWISLITVSPLRRPAELLPHTKDEHDTCNIILDSRTRIQSWKANFVIYVFNFSHKLLFQCNIIQLMSEIHLIRIAPLIYTNSYVLIFTIVCIFFLFPQVYYSNYHGCYFH